MALTDAQLRTIRDEVGTSPDDDTLDDLYDDLGSTTAVALAVLRPRLADALAAAAQGGFTITGALSATPPAQPTLLQQQVSRLEAQYAAETGDTTEVGAVSVVAGRYDRPR